MDSGTSNPSNFEIPSSPTQKSAKELLKSVSRACSCSRAREVVFVYSLLSCRSGVAVKEVGLDCHNMGICIYIYIYSK